jgi:hypothetical protein
MANTAKGKVGRIYPHENVAYIRLEGIPLNATPKDGYFRLDKTHPNYAALYSLALVAAVNRYDLLIRTRAEITNQDHGEVVYMVVDW